MKRLAPFFLAAATFSAFAAEAPKDLKDKASYSIGADMGAAFHKQGLELNGDMLRQGFIDAMGGKSLLMSPEEMQQSMRAWQTEAQGKIAEKNREAGAANKKTGDAFLAENKKKDGVKTTASGLQYKVLTAGKGPLPKAQDTVSVNYRGTLIDGTEFDSSYKRGQPASFQVDGVIQGWTEALQLMPVGSKWQLFIPADLAYADRAPAEIGPGATLIFEVELLKIEAAQPAAGGAATPSGN